MNPTKSLLTPCAPNHPRIVRRVSPWVARERSPSTLSLIGALAVCFCASVSFAVAGSKVIYDKSDSSIDGVPFMPRGVYGVNPDDMDRVAGYGFNVIQTY